MADGQWPPTGRWQASGHHPASATAVTTYWPVAVGQLLTSGLADGQPLATFQPVAFYWPVAVGQPLTSGLWPMAVGQPLATH